jgi:hypothetical protein
MNASGLRSLAAIILSVGTVLVVGAHGAADAATLCEKPSGVLAMRDGACKKKEVPIPPSTFQGAEGPQGSAGSQGPQGPQGLQGPPGASGGGGQGPDVVVDSNHNVVGLLDSANYATHRVLVNLPNYGPAAVGMDAAGLLQSGPPFFNLLPDLFYDSSNCSGEAFLIPQNPAPFVPVAVVNPNGPDLWLPGQPMTGHTSKSLESYVGGPCGGFVTAHALCCVTIPNTPQQVVPAVHVDASVLGTPPFSAAP